MRRSWRLAPRLWVLLGAMGGATALILAPVGWLHVAALPALLVGPGYAGLAAFAGRALRLGLIPTGALSLLLSLAAYALLGLALNTAAIPIGRNSILVVADTLILILVAVAALREGPDEGRGPWVARIIPRGWAPAYIVAALGGLLAVIVTLQLTPKPADAPFTQFYLAGSWARVSQVVTVPGDRSLAVKVGITNHTRQTQEYAIQPAFESGASWPVGRVRVPAGRAWSGVVSGPVPADACLHRLTIQLRARSGPVVLGSLILWVRGTATAQAACA